MGVELDCERLRLGRRSLVLGARLLAPPVDDRDVHGEVKPLCGVDRLPLLTGFEDYNI